MLHSMNIMDPGEKRRQQRLRDVKRGAEFFKKVETLADVYWRDLDPTSRLVNVKGRGQRLAPINCDSNQSSYSSLTMTEDLSTSRISDLNRRVSKSLTSLPCLPKTVTFALKPTPTETPDVDSKRLRKSDGSPSWSTYLLDRQPHQRLDHLVEIDRKMLSTLAESRESFFDAEEEEMVTESERRKVIESIRRSDRKDYMKQRHYNHRSKLLKEFEHPLKRDNTMLILNRVNKLLEPDVISIHSAEGSSRYEWDRGSSADVDALEAILRADGVTDDQKGSASLVATSWEDVQDFEDFLKALCENRMTLSEKCNWWLNDKCLSAS
ncbi:uncharacterized protein LOC135487100 isoform X2 [Lineus longissimus]